MKGTRELKVGVDVDGTLTDFFSPLVCYLGEVEGIIVPSLERTHEYDFSIVWGCSREEVAGRFLRFYQSTHFAMLKPMDGVQDAFRKLFPPHQAHPITARPKSVEKITHDFFTQYFNGNCQNYHHLGSHNLNGSYKSMKSGVAQQLGLDLFIEDSLAEATAISSVGIPVLLMNQPWNAGRQIPSRVTRVNNWGEITEFVERYSRNGNI